MSFIEVIDSFENFDFARYFNEVTEANILKSIEKENLDYKDFLNLISPKAENYLEPMAKRANEVTERLFGRAVKLYTPIYIANICVNKCRYCSYNIENDIKRKKLSLEEIEKEAKEISEKGFKDILLLTGESKVHSPVSYIAEAAKILKKYFSSVTIEIYPLEVEEYKELIDNGVDGLTIYQEVYNKEIYKNVHLKGPKRNYKFRLDGPERGAKAGMNFISIGALLGLDDFRKESFFTALHGKYLLEKYNNIDLSFSLPRIRPHIGVFEEVKEVTDKNLVQSLLAIKLFHKQSNINISTRESAEFRENLLPLGVRKLSAGVSTAVGGHSIEDSGEKQFEINDDRSLEEIKKSLKNKGYQVVLKDWF
ncbi:MAG: 2-iminoacetate synthase ThiH [Sarcina sp.]